MEIALAGNCSGGNCYCWGLSWVGIVLIGNRPGWELFWVKSFWGNCLEDIELPLVGTGRMEIFA